MNKQSYIKWRNRKNNLDITLDLSWNKCEVTENNVWRRDHCFCEGIKKKKKKDWLMCHALACHKLIVLYKNDMMSSDPVESESRTSLMNTVLKEGSSGDHWVQPPLSLGVFCFFWWDPTWQVYMTCFNFYITKFRVMNPAICCSFSSL